MKILSIFTGLPTPLSFNGKEVLSSINKTQKSVPVFASKNGFHGDQAADPSVHGGVNKAIYAYSYEAYSHWQHRRPTIDFKHGAFGENLVIDAIDETKCQVGDEFEVGESILQVSEPRFPCFKFGMKYQDMKMIDDFNKIGRPGVYFRVLRDGHIKVGDELTLIKSMSQGPSISDLFHWTLRLETYPHDWASKMAKNSALSERWKTKLEKSGQ